MAAELHRIPIAQRPAHGPWFNVRPTSSEPSYLDNADIVAAFPPQLVLFPILFNAGLILINLTQLICASLLICIVIQARNRAVARVVFGRVAGAYRRSWNRSAAQAVCGMYLTTHSLVLSNAIT